MTTKALLVVMVLLLAHPAYAAKPAGPSCTTAPTTLAYPDRTGWYLTAFVPAKANVHVIVAGNGAPENEWTNVRGIRQGSTQTIDQAFITTMFTSAGTATAQLVDVAVDGTFTPIVSCSLEVTAP